MKMRQEPDMVPIRSWSIPNLDFVLYVLLFATVCLLTQLEVGAYASDHGQAGDEAAYFVSSLMIKSYVGHILSGGLKSFQNPYRFALLYYAHFPRVGLGHYPPMFSTLQATVFLIFGGTGAVAGGLQALLGGIYAALPSVLIRRQMGAVAGFCAGIAALFSPVVLFLVSTDMADILLAVLVMATAICWSWFYRKRRWFPGIAFSAFAAAAILTKGTAIGLAILPLIHLSYKRDLRFLLDKRTIVCGALVGVVTAPWYIMTYKMAAAGFNYSWGLAYTKIAVPFFSYNLVESVGFPIAGLYAISAAKAAFTKHLPGKIDAHAFLAASLSVILSAFVMPADISARYLVPAIPGLVVAVFWCVDRVLSASKFARSKIAATAVPAILVVISTGSVFQKPHIEPYHSSRITNLVLKSGKNNPLVLVCGSTNFEGAVISTFAEEDTAMSHYVVRGTGTLARGDFMGTRYAARFANPGEMLRWIQKNEIGWIIEEDAPPTDAFPHCNMLDGILRSGASRAFLVGSVHSQRNGGEEIGLYQLPAVTKLPDASDPIFTELKPSVRF